MVYERGTSLPAGWMGEKLLLPMDGRILSWAWQETIAVIVLVDCGGSFPTFWVGVVGGRLVSGNS